MDIRYDANAHRIDDMNNMIEEAAFDDGEINNEEEEGTISSKKRNEISTDKNETKEEPLIANTAKKGSATNNAIQTNIDTTTISDESSSYLTMYGEHRVAQSLASLPKWFQDYVQWNRNATSNRETTKYLVVPCTGGEECGGLSDRLRLLPFLLFTAKHTSRVICFYWTDPHPLETFLEPTELGIDWRCPAEFSESLSLKMREIKWNYGRCDNQCIQKVLADYQKSEDKFILTKFVKIFDSINALNYLVQRHSYVKEMPDLRQGGSGWMYPDMIGDIFRVIFKPVIPLAQNINSTMTRLGLVENEFVSVHVRARYPVPKLKALRSFDRREEFKGLEFEGDVKKYLLTVMENAIKCGNLLAPHLPMYFISDHHNATQYVISNDFIGKDGESFRPLGPASGVIPLHTDAVFLEEVKEIDAEKFYPIFEDLLIMGGSRCVSFGMGSFGSFGAGLSGNRCKSNHRRYNGDPIKECPDNLGERNTIPIDENDMLFGEKSDGEGKLLFVQSQK